MVHSSLHWSEHGVDDISLWPFAVKHAVWLHNRVPNIESGLTPMELVTKQKADHLDILRTHVWGCPAFVLEPNFRMARSYLNGIDGLDLASSLVIRRIILLLFSTSDI